MRVSSLWTAMQFGGRLSRRAASVVVAVVAVSAIAAAVGWGVAAADEKLVGREIPDRHAEVIEAAATSCPALSPARLAGQMMAESGLDEDAERTVSGGRGIAGLGDRTWKEWAPSREVARDDDAANIVALAHYMCHLHGQIRLAGLPGDQWRLSLAAFRTGLNAVREAKRVPKSAVGYVDKADRYAAYYSSRRGTATLQAVAQPSNDAKPIPTEYVKPLLKAGQACPKVPAAAIAAQVMALSGFDSGKVGLRNERGPAQFRPDVWGRYAPRKSSPVDVRAAIPAVGAAMCGLISEFAVLPGDPYMLALWAFKSGTDAVRRTSMPPPATVSYLQRVDAYTDYYQLDTRLRAGAPAKPGVKPVAPAKPAVRPTGPKVRPSPPAAETQTQTRTGTQSPKATTPAKKPEPLPGISFVQVGSGHCIDAGSGADGVGLTMRTCDFRSRAQRWDVRDDGTIRSVQSGLCMDVEGSSTAQGAEVQNSYCNGTRAQQWSIEKNMLRTKVANNCIDSFKADMASGTRLEMVACQAAGHTQQTWRRRS